MEFEQFVVVAAGFGGIVVVETVSLDAVVSSQPFRFGPVASVMLSVQQPYFDLRQAGGGGGQPFASLSSAIVLLSGQQPNSVSLHDIVGQPLNSRPNAGDTPSSQHPYLVSLHVFGFRQPTRSNIRVMEMLRILSGKSIKYFGSKKVYRKD